MAEIDINFTGDIAMSEANDIIAFNVSEDAKSYIDKFTIVDVNNQVILTDAPIQFSTSYDLITVENPDPTDALGQFRSLEDALIGHFNTSGVLDGHYDVDWRSTSIWHEMTIFQNSTASRFFAIWGYFKDSKLIDPASSQFSTSNGWNQSAWDDAIKDATKKVCGSFLKRDDIQDYYRIPRYEITTTTEDGKIATGWSLIGYTAPNEDEAEGLLKRVYENSITGTMYNEVRMQEVLPLERYNTAGTTTAIMSSEEIIKLFTENDNSKSWATSTDIGGGQHTDGPITTIRSRRNS